MAGRDLCGISRRNRSHSLFGLFLGWPGNQSQMVGSGQRAECRGVGQLSQPDGTPRGATMVTVPRGAVRHCGAEGWPDRWAGHPHALSTKTTCFCLICWACAFAFVWAEGTVAQPSVEPAALALAVACHPHPASPTLSNHITIAHRILGGILWTLVSCVQKVCLSFWFYRFWA